MGTTLWSILSILLVVEKFLSYSERKPIKGSGKKERKGETVYEVKEGIPDTRTINKAIQNYTEELGWE